MPRKVRTVEERFWSYVPASREGDHCWLWSGATRSGGYGVLGLGDRNMGITGAHRISWRLHNGEIPKGLFVRHKCDNPPCVNPSHLELGTQKDNMQDAVKRGRINMGLCHATRAENQKWGESECKKGHPKTLQNWHNDRLDNTGKERCFECIRERRIRTEYKSKLPKTVEKK